MCAVVQFDNRDASPHSKGFTVSKISHLYSSIHYSPENSSASIYFLFFSSFFFWTIFSMFSWSHTCIATRQLNHLSAPDPAGRKVEYYPAAGLFWSTMAHHGPPWYTTTHWFLPEHVTRLPLKTFVKKS